MAAALDDALGARGTLLAAWKAADAAATPASSGPDEFERFERALADPRRTDAAVVAHLRRMLAERRRAEDALGPRRLLPPVLAQLNVIAGLARDARGPVRHALLEVTSHYDQFAAWMDVPGLDGRRLGAELAAQTGSALAARELRRVRTVLHKAGADAALSELTEHLRDITATS